jgi:hypothetical protein
VRLQKLFHQASCSRRSFAVPVSAATFAIDRASARAAAAVTFAPRSATSTGSAMRSVTFFAPVAGMARLVWRSSMRFPRNASPGAVTRRDVPRLAPIPTVVRAMPSASAADATASPWASSGLTQRDRRTDSSGMGPSLSISTTSTSRPSQIQERMDAPRPW